jgi:hypothetical protein
MKNIHYAAIKLLISFTISGSLILAGTSLLRYFDPTFSVGFLDLLAQVNLTAWLLLALLAGMIFAGLSALPVSSSERNPADDQTTGGRELSD